MLDRGGTQQGSEGSWGGVLGAKELVVRSGGWDQASLCRGVASKHSLAAPLPLALTPSPPFSCVWLPLPSPPTPPLPSRVPAIAKRTYS